MKADPPISVNELGNFKVSLNSDSMKAVPPIFFSLLDSVRVPFNPVQ